MICFSLHNVTEIENVRIRRQGTEKSGWICLDILAQKYGWDDAEPQASIANDITLFSQDIEATYDSLIHALTAAKLELAKERAAAEKEQAEKAEA